MGILHIRLENGRTYQFDPNHTPSKSIAYPKGFIITADYIDGLDAPSFWALQQQQPNCESTFTRIDAGEVVGADELTQKRFRGINQAFHDTVVVYCAPTHRQPN